MTRAAQFRIDGEGRWFYQGGEIVRQAMVRLFAGQLCYFDGRYLLDTVDQKIAVDVDDVPFIVTAMSNRGSGTERVVSLVTNVEQQVELGPGHALEMRRGGQAGESRPYVELGHDLWARLCRPVFYELVELALSEFTESESDGDKSMPGIWSNGVFFALTEL